MVLTEDIEPMIGFNLSDVADNAMNDLFCVSMTGNNLAAAGSIVSIICTNLGDSNGLLVGV